MVYTRTYLFLLFHEIWRIRHPPFFDKHIFFFFFKIELKCKRRHTPKNAKNSWISIRYSCIDLDIQWNIGSTKKTKTRMDTVCSHMWSESLLAPKIPWAFLTHLLLIGKSRISWLNHESMFFVCFKSCYLYG